MNSPRPSGNPNAIVGGTSGIGGGAAVVAVLHACHVNVDAYTAVVIAGALTAAALFVGRNGVCGVWNALLHGTKEGGG